MSLWAWGWIAIGVIIGIVEVAGLVNSYRAKRAGREDPIDTLSEHIWLWFGFGKQPKGKVVYLRRTVALAALAWLFVHFVFGGEVV